MIELVANFSRNVAYLRGAKTDDYKSWIRPDTNFWRTVTANNIDMAVIEWCKLFVDGKGKHYWRTVVSDPDTFLDNAFAAIGCSSCHFDEVEGQMAEYRNKWWLMQTSLRTGTYHLSNYPKPLPENYMAGW